MTLACTLDAEREPRATSGVDCWTPGRICNHLRRGLSVPTDWPFRLLDARYYLNCCGCEATIDKADTHDVSDGVAVTFRCVDCCPIHGAGVEAQGDLFGGAR